MQRARKPLLLASLTGPVFRLIRDCVTWKRKLGWVCQLGVSIDMTQGLVSAGELVAGEFQSVQIAKHGNGNVLGLEEVFGEGL